MPGFVEAVELMHGEAAMPAVCDLFGAGAFAPGGQRFAAFCQRGLLVAQQFVAAWFGLRQQVAGQVGAGPLTVPAAQAGSVRGDSRHLQRAITAQIEQVQRDALHAAFMAQPQRCPMRQAWCAADQLSSQWVTARPSHDFDLTAEEFGEIGTTYFGIASPAVRPYAVRGLHIPCSRTNGAGRVCDAFGLELGLATLPGDGQTACHDACGAELFDILEESGVRVDRVPRHIFSTLIPVGTLLGTTQYGRPPSIIPDGAISVSLPAVVARGQRPAPPLPQRVLLFDVKTVYAGGELYFSPRARDEQAGAVAERAWRVDQAYQAHARRIDADHSPAGTQPVVARLRSFTRVRGLVFGNYSEASPDVHSLLTIAAEAMAQRRWQSMGARSAEEARSFIVSALRRRLGCFVAREFARYRLRRLPYVGASRAAVAARGIRRSRHGGRDPGAGVRDDDFHAYQALLAGMPLRD